MLIYNCEFSKNSAARNGGAVRVASANMTISFCNLTDNSAFLAGGAISASEGNLFIYNCELSKNSAARNGGAVRVASVNVTISFCNFTENSQFGGGAIFAHIGSVSIYNCLLINNSAFSSGGGAIFAYEVTIAISDCELRNNIGGAMSIFLVNGSILNCIIANNKGARDVISISYGNISFSQSIVTNNSVEYGGVIMLEDSNVIVSDSVLTSNSATQEGIVILVESSSLTFNNTTILDNLEVEVVISVLHSNLSFVGVNTFSNNMKPVYARISRVEFNGPTTLSNNRGVSRSIGGRAEFGTANSVARIVVQGGAIRAVQSQIYINAEGVVISNNTAMSGGGVFLRESTLIVHHPIEISLNTAQNGGGIYAYSSDIEFDPKGGCGLDTVYTRCTCSDVEIELNRSIIVDRNIAQNGRGIYAVASNIILTLTSTLRRTQLTIVVVECTCSKVPSYIFRNEMKRKNLVKHWSNW